MRFINLGTDLGVIDEKTIREVCDSKSGPCFHSLPLHVNAGQQNFPPGDDKNEQD